MDKHEAIELILSESSLSPQERNVLCVMVTHANGLFQCRLHKADIANLTGIHPRTLYNILQGLTEREYIFAPEDNAYMVPYPYCEGLREPGTDRRLFVNRDQVLYLRSLLTEKETQLTVLAQSALDRNERLRHKDITAILDTNSDVAEVLDRYIERTKPQPKVSKRNTFKQAK